MNKLQSTKKLIVFAALFTSLLLSGCYGVMQTAEIIPKKTFSHSFTGTLLADDYFMNDDIFLTGIGYRVRYGAAENLEINSGIDLFWPRVYAGFKYGLREKIAINTNLNALTPFDADNIYFTGDAALIIGTSTYGGLKIIFPLSVNGEYQLYPFIGKKFKTGKRLSIITEIGITSDFLVFSLSLNS